MTKKLKGLREPSGSINNALRIGTLLKVRINGKRDATMMLSALVRKNDRVYALVTPHSRVGIVQSGLCELMRGPGRKGIRVGHFVPVSEVLGDKSPSVGFLAVALEASPLFNDPAEAAANLVTTRNFRSNLWKTPNLRVRRVNAQTGEPQGRRSRRKQYYAFQKNKLGRVAGEMFDVVIEDGDESLSLPYCGLVSSRGKVFADADSVGAPVISRSGALSGFIVGRSEDDNLILPIDEFSKEKSISFVTFGEDWPKVLVNER